MCVGASIGSCHGCWLRSRSVPCNHTHLVSDLSGASQSAHSEGNSCSPEEHAHPSVMGFGAQTTTVSPHGLGRQWHRVNGRWHEEMVDCLCQFVDQAIQHGWVESAPHIAGLRERTFTRGRQ